MNSDILRSILVRALLVTLLWLVLTEGAVTPWPLILLVIGAVTAMSLVYRGPVRWRWRLSGLLRFVPFFLYHSLVGGVDVGLRAFRRRIPVAPTFIRYEMRLPPFEPPARFFAATLSLLPGTLCASMQREILSSHVVDDAQPNAARLHQLESRVADLFGETLPPLDGGKSA